MKLIMGREQCGMCDYLGSTRYCDYFDAFSMKCSSIKYGDCPDGLDDDDEDEEWDIDEQGES